jgi:alanine racemase
VACGYADGYQRISPTGTPVLVDSVRTRTVGRVSMDMLAVDLTGIESAKVGSEVVLWGQSKVQASFYLLTMLQFHPVRWVMN